MTAVLQNDVNILKNFIGICMKTEAFSVLMRCSKTTNTCNSYFWK